MNHSSPIEDSAWWAIANYVRGAASKDEALQLERHLFKCEACRAELIQLQTTLDAMELDAMELDAVESGTVMSGDGMSGDVDFGAMAPVADAKPLDIQRILLRLRPLMQAHWESAESMVSEATPVQTWKNWKPGGLGLAREADIPWQTTPVPGIEVKRLFVTPSGDFVTMLVRMAPGASYPAHRHGGVEQCFVVDGDLHAGERTMHSGDFEVVERNSVHPVQWTERGCRLLIVSSTQDELLEA